ncbi:MAG: lpxD [Verrucomicrobiaceae bacterium]|nr:lpxD [Verrucomicrobiaceae bacterium]
MAHGSLTLGEVADLLGLECRGERTRRLTGLANLALANEQQLSFLANPKYRKFLEDTHAGAIIVTDEIAADASFDCLISPNPYLSYARASHLFDNRPRMQPGVHATAVIAASASIGAGVAIGAHCAIGAGVQIGANTTINSGTVVGENCSIGSDCILHANVTLYHAIRVGDGCVIHSGAVIGADGFGFAPGPNGWEKIAQLGSVQIGNGVEIGANTTVDRGALEDTLIGDGAIIDNLCQIAHNVQIGEGTAIAGCVGIAGSTIIGAHCMIGGGAGIAGHITIADGVQIQGRARIIGSITKAGSYTSGTGMMETSAWRKNAVRFGQLDELYRRVVELEKQIKKSQSSEE